MSATTRLVFVVLGLSLAVPLSAGEVPKNSPFSQAGTDAAAEAKNDPLEFAGVSIVGKKTSINLYDKQTKRSFWVDVGASSGGVSVVKYDMAHDQVTVRRNGVEKTLPLRSSSVANGPAIQPTGATSPALVAPAGPVATPLPVQPPPPATTQARQEEEARMLVSDLLEIGMAQRKAYEDAQRRAASGQPGLAQPAQAAQPVMPMTPEQAQAAAAAAANGTQAAAAPATATPPGGG